MVSVYKFTLIQHILMNSAFWQSLSAVNGYNALVAIFEPTTTNENICEWNGSSWDPPLKVFFRLTQPKWEALFMISQAFCMGKQDCTASDQGTNSLYHQLIAICSFLGNEGTCF